MNPDKVYAEYVHAKATARKERARLKALREAHRHALEAQALIQAVAKEVQARAQGRVSYLVSRCLREVFGEHAYVFRLKMEAKRGKTETKPVFVRDGKELDPVDESGLGQVDVAAFALRLAALLLHNPPVRRLLVLDEPFKYVSAEYVPRVRELLEALSSELGVQIIMSTHNRELETGNVIRID